MTLSGQMALFLIFYFIKQEFKIFSKKLLTGAVFVFLFIPLTFAGISKDWNNPGNPWIDATGGPDQFGYTWIDSDEPGGPPFNWIDITATGTQIRWAGQGQPRLADTFRAYDAGIPGLE